MHELDVIEGLPRRRWLGAAGIALLSLLGVVGLWMGTERSDQHSESLRGLHLTWQAGSAGGHQLLLTFELLNEGKQAMEVLGIGGDQPSLRFVNAVESRDMHDPGWEGADSLPTATELAPGQAKEFVVSYRVLKCSAPSEAVMHLTVRARAQGREVSRVLEDEFGPILSRLFEAKRTWSVPCAPTR